MPYADFGTIMKKLRESTFEGAMVSGLNEILIISQNNEYNFTFKFCKERLMGIPIVIYFKKNYFLIPEINKVIRNLNSGGLIEKWHYNYIDKRYLKKADDLAGPKVITVGHLSGSFQVWACGCMLAIICFLAEIMYHRFKNPVAQKKPTNDEPIQFEFKA